ncbi:MAG: ATP-binding protein [Calditrichia bacterium]
MAITELKSRQLKKSIPLNHLPFVTTDEIEPLSDIIGQERAIRAIKLALEMEHSGYNVFVTGISGTGKTTIVNDLLEKMAQERPVPPDWVYVFNFEEPDEPMHLKLPAGRARQFQADMAELITTLKKELKSVFSGEEYNKQKLSIINHHNERKRRAMERLERDAESLNLKIQSSSSGFETLVMKDGKPISQEEFDMLPVEKKKEISRNVEKIQNRIEETLQDLMKIDRGAYKELRELNESIATFVVTRYLTEMEVDYKDCGDVVKYLNMVEADIIRHVSDFLNDGGEDEPKDLKKGAPDLFKRYQVNVLVNHEKSQGAPVIYEPNPTYSNLFGRIEKQVIMGSQVTDFTMIKPGSLHRANGGYLITDAHQLLKHPIVYDALKRAIRTREIRIEDVSELYGVSTAAGLRPKAIPMDLKVIIVGGSNYYYILQAYDQDFSKIFKIRADFDYAAKSNRENAIKYAEFVKRVCLEENLLPFHKSAVREVLHYSHRLVDDQKKMSLQFGAIMGVLREANHFAKKDGDSVVRDVHIRRAIEESEYRHSLIYDRMKEMYERDIYKISTTGEKIGEINGLSVVTVGGHSFGRPGRITAKSYIGNENVVNIERKVRLSGKIHDKGVMILNGFFNSKFGTHIPLNFSASITFEQSYGMIDGDSASSTELYALISSLADVPIRQGIAVTGSVNQNGEIQAIGGVNQKIEGYYEICKQKGLTGEQGVMIPSSNRENLMLKDEVRRAVARGLFHIWTVDTIEDGLFLLTGLEAGERLPNGHFPKDSIYQRVEKKLRLFAKRADAFRKQFNERPNKKKEPPKESPEEDKNQE